MSAQAELVTEFRDIVDQVISSNASSRPGRSWLGMNQEAQLGGLNYASVDKKHGRPRVIGMGDEHRWGIVTSRLLIGRYSGRVALVSVSGAEEILERHISIESPLQTDIYTDRPLETEDVIRGALSWARSPHLFPEELKSLASLDQNEEDHIAVEYARQLEAARETQVAIENMRNLQAAAWQNARNTIIG